ncbi:DUF3306 domain-containing protein [Stappia sp. F7233]|uniref:DUF3306 domain-containing protein n=1 Tax=Stappia albiluteola TaxID=2758565 RepID=A0A839AB44_9HYPH|nr:DUF3306 domain-containing protein [Stappia albiluteola]MBA5776631.1 DUF3306 domain-containing protein [Stappia albiluteola]
MGEEEGFLKRWSRLKQEAQTEPEAPTAEEETQDELDVIVEEAEDIEAANRAAAEAVDLEGLSYDSDFSVFLKKGVPAALKNAALRKLWASNPVLANVDGLNDYDEDFRLGNQLGREFRSAWEAGRGYARKFEEMRKKAAEASGTEPVAGAAPTDAPSQPADETRPSGPDAEPDADDGADSHAAAPGPAAADDPKAFPDEPREDEKPNKVSLRRRMTFGEG